MAGSSRKVSMVAVGLLLAAAAVAVALPPSPRARGAVKDDASDVSGAVDRMTEQIKRGPVHRTPEQDRSSLFLLDVASGEATLITDEPDRGLTYCGSPRWSADGRRILFDATPGTDWRRTRLKLIDLAGDRLKIADLGPGNCPTFSPDGERIAFLVNSGAAPDLDPGVWVMRSGGVDRKRLDTFGIPLWSPDGRQLLIVAFGNPIKMQIMDVDDWSPRPVELPGFTLHTSPRWAGPNTLVAAAETEEGAGVALFDISNPEEGKLKEILWKRGDRLDVEPAYPIFSPVTRTCVFVGKDDNGLALYSIRQGSFGPPKKLEPTGYDAKLAGLEFSPDGRYVLFCGNRPDRRAAVGVRGSGDGSE